MKSQRRTDAENLDALRPIGGGADDEQHFDQLDEAARDALANVGELSDDDLDQLEDRLAELARSDDTPIEQVAQAVDAVQALRAERGTREEAAEAENTRRAELLSTIDEPEGTGEGTGDGEGEGEGDGDGQAATGDGEGEGEGTGDGQGEGEGTGDGEGEGEGDGAEGTDGEGDGEAAAGTAGEGAEGEAGAEGAAAAGTGNGTGRRAPVRTAARRPSPGAVGRRSSSRSTPPPADRPRTQLVDARGNNLANFNEAAQRLIRLRDAMGHGGGGDGDFVSVGQLRVEVPRDRQITDPQNGEANQAIIAAVSSPEALTAAGGFCAPTAVEYDVVNISDSARPYRDSLAQVGAPRGGVRFARPVNFDALSGAVRLWTATDDENAADPQTHPEAVKPCIRVECQDFDEVIVRAIPWCLTFGNLGARAWPEQVADALRSVLAMHARVAEAEIGKDVVDASTAVSSPIAVSATRDLLDVLDRIVQRYRYFYRTADNFPMRAVLPRFVRGMLRSDLARELPGSTDERLAVADATLDSFFAARSINVTWRADEPRGTTAGTDFFGDQDAGAVINWPDVVNIQVFHEGAFGFLSTPEIDFGLVRDSSLNARNDYTIMAETFEGVAHRGFKAFNLAASLCPSGATSGTVDYDCPDGS